MTSSVTVGEGWINRKWSYVVMMMTLPPRQKIRLLWREKIGNWITSGLLDVDILLWLSEYCMEDGSVIIQVRCVKMSTLFGESRCFKGGNLQFGSSTCRSLCCHKIQSSQSGSGSGGCLSTHFSLVCVTFPQIARCRLYSHSVQVRNCNDNHGKMFVTFQ